MPEVFRRFNPEELPIDPQARIDAIARFEKQYFALSQELWVLQQTLQTEVDEIMAALDGQEPQFAEFRKLEGLREALGQLQRGVGYTDGVIQPLTKVVGKPGLGEVERTLRRMQKLRWEAIEELNFDPEVRAPYRLRYNVGDHIHNGARVRPGQIVELNAREAKNWSDKFDLVEPKELSKIG